MTNRNIEDIDQLFREGLNPGKDPFSPPEGEWVKMEQRLNRYNRKKGAIIWLTRLGAAAALLFLFFMLRTLLPVEDRQNIQQSRVQQKDTSQAVKQTREPSQNEPSSEKTAALKQENKAIKTVPSTEDPLAQNKHQKQNTMPSAPNVDTIQEKTMDRDSLRHFNEQNMITGPVVIAREENTPVTDSKQGKTIERDTLQPFNQPNTKQESSVIAREENTSSTQPEAPAGEKPSRVETPAVAIGGTGQKPEVERSVRKMVLSVMAAPAYNAVSSLNNGNMGNDFGLLVSLEIARHWSVSTGGIYAKKLYDTGFKDYNPKNNIWSEYYPQTVSADCRVLDIPMNLGYTLFKGKNRTISLGTGLSSYIMLREDYRFTYGETDPDTPLAYRVVNQNRHWLSVLNFQATIEQRINKRFSISLQPYMKLPLADIGFAGVKLQSLGMAANLNWNFSL